MRSDIVPGAIFPDYELSDHTAKRRKLSDLQGQHPMVLVLSRGGFCPKDRRQAERLLELHREMEVGYCRLVTISTDNITETNEYRTGVGAHWPFLSDTRRIVQKDLDIAEYTDPVHNPMIPHVIVLEPGLIIYKIYNGYWFFGRPTLEELRQDLRAVTKKCRPDWDITTIAEPSWPPPAMMPRRLFLTDEGLREAAAPLTARAVCSSQTVGKSSGEWVPFGRGRDQAGDQQEDDVGSLVFETRPLDEPIEILGAPIVTLDVASDRPIANLVVRLCDVHPPGESLRVSYGVLNLTHRDGHEKPTLLTIGQHYRIRIQLNDAGSVFPAGHKVRLAMSTAYWPMIWPSPEATTLQIFAGSLDLPQRSRNAADASLSPFPEPETAAPEKPTILHRDGVRVERIDRIGLELGTQWKTQYHVEENDPLSAGAELHNVQTVSRNEWQIRVETQMRMSSTGNAFQLQASLRAWEGANEVCRRDLDRSIPRDFL